MHVHPARRFRPSLPARSGLALAFALLAAVPSAFAQGRTPGTTTRKNSPMEPVTPSTDDKRLDETKRKKARYQMDFDKVDIQEVIKFISQWTNKNFILPENIRGKITIIGPQDVTADEAYQAFLAALQTNNLTIAPTGKFLKVVQKKEGIKDNIPIILRGGDVPDDERMVTKIFRLRYNDSDPIKNVLQQFVSREGEIVPFPPDMLIISDFALNIRRLDKLLEQLDQPGSQDEINVLQIENASASEVSAILLQIFQQQGGAAQPGRRAGLAPAMPKEPGAAGAAGATASDSGPVSVSKIIADERTNKLIIIGNAKSFQRIKDLTKKLDVPTDTGQVHVHYLENADAEELASTLQALSTGQSSSGGSKGRTRGATPAGQPAAPAGASSAALFSGEVKITADKATNSLLIIASPSDFRNMVKVINRLDIRRRQVFIEAVIMEVKLNGENRFSIDVHGGYAIKDVQINGTDTADVPVIFGSEVSSPGASLSLAGLASLNGFLAGIQGPPIKIDGLGINLPSFGVVLNALQKNSDVNVISTPHIMTSDNEEAEITVGSQVPFQSAVVPGIPNLGSLGGLTSGTSSASALSSQLLSGFGGLGAVQVQRQPVELRLKVKPQINESDFIRLEIDEQLEEISSIDRQLGPTTAKRGVKTTIVAKDQSTVVIGGLIQDRVTRAETKVPILGSIPVLGKLFRAENEIREKTNLLLFLTPYVIRDQSDFRRIFERKMKERQEFVARFFGSSDEYAANIDYERKRGPLGVLHKNVQEEFDRAENGGNGGPGETIIRAPPDEGGAIPVPPGGVILDNGTGGQTEPAPAPPLEAPPADEGGNGSVEPVPELPVEPSPE